MLIKMVSLNYNPLTQQSLLLTLPQTSPGFYVSAVQVFWKHTVGKGEIARDEGEIARDE